MFTSPSMSQRSDSETRNRYSCNVSCNSSYDYNQWKSVKRELLDEDKEKEESDDSRDKLDKKAKASDYDSVNTHDDDKRKQRRERNKMAAAKCRQRRVDQTNALLHETEQLETEKTRLEDEIRILEIQRAELRHVLDTHSIDCTNITNKNLVKEEKSFYDVRNMTSNFQFQNGVIPYDSLEEVHTNCRSEHFPFKNTNTNIPTSTYVNQQYKQHSQVDFPNRSMQCLGKTSQFETSDKNNTRYNHPQFHESLSTFEQNHNSFHFESSNSFPMSANSLAVDLSNAGQGYRTSDGNIRKHSNNYNRLYERHMGDHSLNTNSCAKSSSLKPFTEDQVPSKMYNNNNNYIPSHPTVFYKNGSDAYSDSCLVASNSNSYSYEDLNLKPSCSRHYSSHHEAVPSHLTNGGSTPCYQNTLESVLNIEER